MKKNRLVIFLVIILSTTSLHSQHCPQAVLDQINLQDQLGEAKLKDIQDSGNSLGNHPPELMLDGDKSSFFSFTPGSRYGSVHWSFEDTVSIESLTIQGYLPEGSTLYLKTMIENRWITLPAGFIQGQGESFFLDLSQYRILSDNLQIHLAGDNLEQFRINEIYLGASSAEKDLHKKQLVPQSLFYSNKYLNNDFLLVDGKIGTSWNNWNRGFEDTVYWLNGQNISGQYHRSHSWKTKERILFHIPRSGEMEFFKIFLNEESTGKLTLLIEQEVDGVSSWKKQTELDLDPLWGWQKIDLRNEGKIISVALEMEDPQKPWTPGNYGGIGEVELWGRKNPEEIFLKDLIAPAPPFDPRISLFHLPDLEERDYQLLVVSDSDLPPGVNLNGHPLTHEKAEEYPGFFIWEYPLNEHFLLEQNNLMRLELSPERIVYTAQLLLKPQESLTFPPGSLFDKQRYSGQDPILDSLLINLPGGEADIEEIHLFFKQQDPEYFSLLNDGLEWSPAITKKEPGQQIFQIKEPIDQLSLGNPGDIQEIELKGSPSEILHPWIKLLFPLEDVKIEQNQTYHYKVIGITDTPEGEIFLNGIPAKVRDNYFWVEMRDLGIHQTGRYNLTAEVIHPNGNRGSDSANIVIESDSNQIQIDQEDRLYTTRDSSFLLSGMVRGNTRNLQVNGREVSLSNNGLFSIETALDEGLNFIRIELINREGTEILNTKQRRVFRQSTPPELTIESPLEGYITNQDSIILAGKVTPWGLIKVEVNGLKASQWGNNYQCNAVPLMGESTAILVQAFYEDGLVLEERVLVTRDKMPPLLSSIEPASGTLIGEDRVLVTGIVEEENECTVFINGLIASITGNRFSRVIPLPLEGNNRIIISARDQGGNSLSLPPFTVFRDNVGPEPFEVLINPAGVSQNQRPVIHFETTDTGIGMGYYAVSIGGGRFLQQESPTRLPFLEDGDIPIVVRAYDLFGNSTDSTVYAHIDTKAPQPMHEFKVISGKNRVLIRWEYRGQEELSYQVGLSDDSQKIHVTEEMGGLDPLDPERKLYEIALEGLEPGKSYGIYLQPVDLAGNRGQRSEKWVYTTETECTVESNGISHLEYDGVEIFIPQGSLPEQADRIIFRESEDSFAVDKAVNPVLSPVYNLSVAADGAGEAEHVQFSKPFVGELSYREDQIPEGVPEYKLAVFYFDDRWNRWFITENNHINTETNTITFATDHFTEFTVQPTLMETLDYRDWKGMEYPLTSESTSHSPIQVSPQSGSASTAMTEFMLPGLNGMDLIIRRIYNSSVADADATLLPLNIQVAQKSLEMDNEDSPGDLLQFYQENLGGAHKAWYKSVARELSFHRAELAATLGQGWRLDVPYIRFSDQGVMLSIPGEEAVFTKDMREETLPGNNIRYTDELNHGLTIDLERFRAESDAGENSENKYTFEKIMATGRAGRVYLFSKDGQIESITDPYGNRISYTYEKTRLIKITDTCGREVFFSYYPQETAAVDQNNFARYIPLIRDITLFDAENLPAEKDMADISAEELDALLGPKDFHIRYFYDMEQPQSVGLPLLLSSTDTGGRKWEYGYDAIYLESQYTQRDWYTYYDPYYDEEGNLEGHHEIERSVPSYYPQNTKSQFVFPLTSIEGPGVGREQIIYGENLQELTLGGIDYRSLKQTLKEMGTDRELEAKIQALAVQRIDTRDQSGKIKKSGSYSYLMYKGRIYRTIYQDERLREVTYLEEKSFTIDYPNSRFLFWENQNTETIKATLETKKQRFTNNYVSWELAEEYNTYFEQNRLLPSRESIQWGIGGQKRESLFNYDRWGNPIWIFQREINHGYTHSQITWNWYGAEIPPGAEYLNLTPAPFVENRPQNSIHDRILRSYSTYTTTGEYNDSPEWDSQSVFQYNPQGSLTASAERQEDRWIEKGYQYDLWGRLVGHTNPLGQVTGLSYNREDYPYEEVITTEYGVIDETGDAIDRKNISHLDKTTGWTLEQIRADGLSTVMERDRLGRITALTKPKNEGEPAAPTINISYNDPEMTVTQTDPLQNKQIYRFNNRGEIIAIEKYDSSENLLQKTEIGQDYYGNVAWVLTPNAFGSADPEQEKLEYAYDGLGRILEERYREEGELRRVTYRYDSIQNLVIRTDEAGGTNIMHQDAGGRTVQVQELSGEKILRTTSTRFNARGEVIAEIDPDKEETRYFYNQQGDLVKTVSPEGSFFVRGESFTSPVISEREYNLLGQVSIESLSTNRGEVQQKEYQYDKLGRLTTEILPYSDILSGPQIAKTRHLYDILDREVETIDPSGNSWKREYNNRGQVIEELNPENAKTTYTYDLKDRLKSMTDARENSGNYPGYRGTLTYRYDDLDRLTGGILPAARGEEPREIQFHYDREGNLLQRIEPDGSNTIFRYTTQNRLKSQKIQEKEDLSGISYETRFEYDELGNLIKNILPDGSEEIYTYDGLNRKIREDLPEGVIQRFGYDKKDNLLWQENGRGFQNRYSYDNLNRLTLRVDEEMKEWRTFYDPQGNITRTEDPAGIVRSMEYDERGSLKREQDGQGLVKTYRYDQKGNLYQLTDARGTEITYNYRKDNLPLSVYYSNPGEEKTHQLSYRYDEAGALIQASDNGLASKYNQEGETYTPDPYNRISRVQTGNLSDISFSYDNRDRLTGITNGANTPVVYRYNALGQLQEIQGILDHTEHNLQGQLTGYQLANGMTMKREFDDKQRLSRLEYTTAERSKLYEYRYDRAGNLIDENGSLYSYDGRNMLAMAMLNDSVEPAIEEEVEDQEILLASNDVLGQLELELPVDEDFSLTWGARSVAAEMSYPSLISGITLHLDGPAGERISRETLQVLTSISGQEGSFSEVLIDSFIIEEEEVKIRFTKATMARYVKVHSHYNDRDAYYQALNTGFNTVGLDRDSPFTITRKIGGGRNEFYLYDDRGNRSKKTLMEGGIQSSPYTYYPGSDWLKYDETFYYRYDGNGNLIEKGSVGNEFSGSVTILQEGIYWRYHYDLRNRLSSVEKLIEEELIQVATYTYDINGFRVLKDNARGETTKYVFDLSGNMIEEIPDEGESIQYVFMCMTHIAQINGNESVYYFGTNHLGSTTLLTDENGDTLMDVETTPFGDQDEKGLFYTGKQWDEDVELYYFNARWYDPETARFITEDPVKDGLLWFAYVNNNPMGFVDPTGMRQIKEATTREKKENEKESHRRLLQVNEIHTNLDKLKKLHEMISSATSIQQAQNIEEKMNKLTESLKESISLYIDETDLSGMEDFQMYSPGFGTAYLFPMKSDENPEGFNSVLGNFMVIDHGNGNFSLLAHFESFAVENMQKIKPLDYLGAAGNTTNFRIRAMRVHGHWGLFTGVEDGIIGPKRSTSILYEQGGELHLNAKIQDNPNRDHVIDPLRAVSGGLLLLPGNGILGDPFGKRKINNLALQDHYGQDIYWRGVR